MIEALRNLTSICGGNRTGVDGGVKTTKRAAATATAKTEAVKPRF